MYADTVYTVSSATDHYREQSRCGGFDVERCPHYPHFYSTLQHYPSTTFRLKGTDHVPHFISREYFSPQPNSEDVLQRSRMAAVSGPRRHRYSQKPLLAGNAPIVVVKAPQPAQMLPAKMLEPLDHPIMEATRTYGTQSDFRESDAQTDPYSPDVIKPAKPLWKQQMLSSQYHCDGPEVCYLSDMKFGAGLPSGAIEVERIDRLRAKRKFEASLPPLSEVHQLPVRQQMMEAWEKQEWEIRDGEIRSVQDERLSLLSQAIMARETEQEEANADRIHAASVRSLTGKADFLVPPRANLQDAFTTIQRTRTKVMRHLKEARKHVDGNRFTQKESIIAKYSQPGSRAYAPPQREGIFPDSKPKGKEVETEHFGPTSLAGIAALEGFLPKHLLDMKMKVMLPILPHTCPEFIDLRAHIPDGEGLDHPSLPDARQERPRRSRTLCQHLYVKLPNAPQKSTKLNFSQRRELAMRAHLDQTAALLAKAHASSKDGSDVAEAQKKARKRKKVIVRNAARPETPIQARPSNQDELHKAAMLLQRLVRGCAIQNDIYEGCMFRSELITELLQPPRTDVTAAAGQSEEHSSAACILAPAIREVLQMLAMDSPAQRQAALDELGARRRALDEPEAHGDGITAEERATIKIQAGFRGFKARKRVAVLKAEGAAVRESLAAGNSIMNLASFDDDDVQRITTLQANMRGHLARKKAKAMRLHATHEAISVLPDIALRDDNASADQASSDGKSALAGKCNQALDPDASVVTGLVALASTSVQEASAVKLQAGIRGYLARRQVKGMKAQASSSAKSKDEHTAKVLKVQAGIRGYLARKKVRAMKREVVVPESHV